MNKVKTLTILNLLSLVIHVTLSYLTQFKLVNQSDVGQVSDQFDSLFTPAGITFAIWGVIYTTLAILCLYHIIIAYKHDAQHPGNRDVSRMGGLFILNNLATAAWLFAWTNNQIGLSLLLIAIQLIALILIHSRLGIMNRERESGSIICTQLPLSIYLGWIAIATIANASIYLVAAGWNGLGISAQNWTITMIVIAVLLGLFMVVVRKNVWFGLVIIWGLYGIILKRQQIDMTLYRPIILAAWAGTGVLAAAALFQAIRNFMYRRKGPTFPEERASLK